MVFWGTTQLEHASQGIITKEIQIIAQTEGLSEAFIMEHVAKGEIVIPCNPKRNHQKVIGIGTGLRTKVNASIGTSSDICDSNSRSLVKVHEIWS